MPIEPQHFKLQPYPTSSSSVKNQANNTTTFCQKLSKPGETKASNGHALIKMVVV
jgi:hypothetical protein